MAPTKKEQLPTCNIKWLDPIRLFKKASVAINGVKTEYEVKDGKFVESDILIFDDIGVCVDCRGDAETGDVCIACDKMYCRKCIMAWLEKYNAIWMVCDGNICEKCYLKQ